MASSRRCIVDIMRIPRCYTEQQLKLTQTVVLEQNVSHHLLHVLRLRCGDSLILFNGDGKEHSGILANAQGKLAVVELSEERDTCTESGLHIELGQGISRGERMDFVLQKSVELGVSAVTPLWTSRSQVKLNGPRLEKRLAHWRAIIRSACEQSGRSVLPSLNNARSLAEWCGPAESQLKLVLDPSASAHLCDFPATTRVTLLVGPEGGLEPGEIRLAEAGGFERVRLGPRTLRTETAALAALTAVQTLWGDLAS